MKGNLVIVESPTKATTIQKFLGKDEYTVKSSFGHIRDLQDKKLSVDIAHGFTPEYVISPDKKKLVAELKQAAQEAETVWLASDEDREGEAISWHLAQTLKLAPEKTRRIVFHEITKAAILHAIQHPREVDMSLVNAQQARRVLDRLVGFELSPVLWRKIRRGLSAGRVQSVALRLIVEREREILQFRSEPYYRVEAVFSCGRQKVSGLLDTRFATLEEARKFLEDSIGAVYTVSDVEKKEGVRMPAAPFTTSTLQQEASRKLHFPVGTTMRIAQGLYERGLITYMRTDSTNLSSLAVGTAKAFIREQFGEQYARPRQYKTHTKGAQEAHEAIRPTFIDQTDIEGTPQEKKLYNLIWKRTLASQMAEARVLNSHVKVSLDKRTEQYAIQATEILFDGFLKLYMESREEDEEDDDREPSQILPEFRTGDILQVQTVAADCKFSQAPPRYSEATLIKKLEELGIGRPSTYSPTISTLTTGRGYVTKGDKGGTPCGVENLLLQDGVIRSLEKTEIVGAEKRKLLPQEIGIIVSDYLVANFPGIMDYDFTANVEKEFDQIAAGKLAWNKLISDFYAPFHQAVEEAVQDRQYKRVERELGVDPSDGKPLIAKYGQYGPYVQKGDGEDRQFASLAAGQLIESLTLEEALRLFQLPRVVGQYAGVDVIATKGRFGPFLKYGTLNVSMPKGADPLRISLEESISLIEAGRQKEQAASLPLKAWKESDIAILNGRYGPYIRHAGGNYRIPKGTDAAQLDEQACRQIIEAGSPTTRKFRRYKKSR